MASARASSTIRASPVDIAAAFCLDQAGEADLFEQPLAGGRLRQARLERRASDGARSSPIRLRPDTPRPTPTGGTDRAVASSTSWQ